MAAVKRGNRNIKWIESYCKVPEGEFVGQPLKLVKFQKDVVKGIYDEITRTVIISFGRKNAKTTLSACLCLLHLCGPEAVPNSQLYSAAQSRDQAGILFDLMKKIIRQSEVLSEVLIIRESAKQIYCEALGTLYRALSAEASTSYGLSPVFVVHDELGQVRGPRSAMFDALETAAGAQKDPLSIIISTQAPEDGDLLSVLIDDALESDDSETKVFLYSADESLDPFSIQAIKQANPAYGKFLNAKEVKRQANKAKRMPSSEASYRNLILNQRIAAEAPFVSRTVWDLNSAKPRKEDFENIFVAIDLSEYVDLTALTYCGVGDDGVRSLECRFFMPEDGIRERSQQDRVPYDVWSKEGYITLTPGKSVDFAFVAHQLIELDTKYNIVEVRCDPWNLTRLERELELAGCEHITLEKQYQGFNAMCSHINFFEAELVNGRIRHGNNPVLTNHATNAVTSKDPEGKRKFDKKKSNRRIDGMVAAAMCIGGSVLAEEEGSVDDFLEAITA